MKYKVGDKVRVRENLPLYMKAHCVSTFSPETLKYNGMIVTVSEVKKDQYKIEEDKGFYDWYEDMLEPVEEMSAEEAIRIQAEMCRSIMCKDCAIDRLRCDLFCGCDEFRSKNPDKVLEILKQWKRDYGKKEVEVEFAWYAVIKDEKGSIVHEERIESPLGSNKEYLENNKEILAKYCSEHNGKFYELTERRCVVKE